MIPKQWFEEQGIAIKEYSKEVTYTVELENGDRKIKLGKGELKNNKTYVVIEIFEQNMELAIYFVEYFNETEIQNIITKWLTELININQLHTINEKIQIGYLYDYYLKFGQKGFVISSWDSAKENLINYDLQDSAMDLVYSLCANSTYCTQFYCLISDSRHIRFTSGNLDNSDNTYFCLEIKGNTYEVCIDYERENQEFPTPHEAVAYLETLLAGHLKNA